MPNKQDVIELHRKRFLIAQLGSNWNNSDNAGSFYWNCNNNPGNYNNNLGSRLLNALFKFHAMVTLLALPHR